MIENGKHNMSIKERARRIYLPNWRTEKDEPRTLLSLQLSHFRPSTRGSTRSGAAPQSASKSRSPLLNNSDGKADDLKSFPGDANGGQEEEYSSLNNPDVGALESVISHISGLTLDGVGIFERPDIADAYDYKTMGTRARTAPAGLTRENGRGGGVFGGSNQELTRKTSSKLPSVGGLCTQQQSSEMIF